MSVYFCLFLYSYLYSWKKEGCQSAEIAETHRGASLQSIQTAHMFLLAYIDPLYTYTYIYIVIFSTLSVTLVQF